MSPRASAPRPRALGPRLAAGVAGVVVAGLLGAATPAGATNFDVASDADLRSRLDVTLGTAAADGDTITFTADVTLTADLPAIQRNLTIRGNNKILDGASTYRGFFVAKFSGSTQVAVTVAIQDLTIQNAKAQGGAGGSGAGGGAGLGGALFVANLASVTASKATPRTDLPAAPPSASLDFTPAQFAVTAGRLEAT